ncbi:4-(cytidine 5'-diphospho)-2-C-methyl-D-erythritol kinase [Roseobacteraceae bacterium NS-SX3]
MATEAFAPAKINLTLHVTGQRADGYHLLDSLVGFASAGDRLRAEPADGLSLTVTGPRAEGVPEDGSNLVLRAARLLDADRGAALTLEKHLPAASGIGGGSSDAAAALRALSRLWDLPLPAASETLALGADLPVCMAPGAQRMTGVGERLAPVDRLPGCGILLVNPGVEVPTPAVFKALARKDNAPMPENLPRWRDAAELAGWLATQRNDLQAPALALAPVIGEVLTALRATGCLHAAMSGSGATCYALFSPGTGAAEAAEARIRAEHPGWWAAAGRLF